MPDLTTWTDEELCRELAAQSCDGEARLKPERWHLAHAEYERRLGNVKHEEEVFTQFRDYLKFRKQLR